ncbi:MAG TPA: AraC family transcriptional regulator [Anaerovoracaceae bacterium]|nr:AraC family transcriptional regulator [Anaerovoracaceae bacterium]
MTMRGVDHMQQEIKILIAVLAKLDSGDTYKPHSHPYYQLNHIVQGSFAFEIEGRKFTAEVGDTILIPANSVHTFTQTSDVKGYYFEVKFSSFSKGVMEMCADAGVFVKNDEFSGLLLKEIFEEKNNSTPESEEIMITYLYSILFKLTEKKRREKNTSSKYIEVSAYSSPVRDIVRFLENNYKKRLTLDDIVAETPLKKSYLCGLFKKETTVTIFECLMIIRVRKAVELLTYNPMPLSQVSKETGFVNITHFNRVFTKHVMIPPGQFRRYLNSQDLNWNDAAVGRKVNHITAATLEGKKIDFPQLLSE